MSDYRRWLLATSVLFALSLALGAGATMQDPAIGQQVLDLFREAFSGDLLGSPPPVLALTLFFNNLQACLIMFLGGASFGLLTAFVIMTNGVVIGAIVELIRQQQGALYIAAALVPHGIFEIPAFIIAGTLGFLLAGALWAEWQGQGDAAAEAARLGRTFLLVVLPLVTLAAVTEAFITPGIIAGVA